MCKVGSACGLSKSSLFAIHQISSHMDQQCDELTISSSPNDPTTAALGYPSTVIGKDLTAVDIARSGDAAARSDNELSSTAAIDSLTVEAATTDYAIGVAAVQKVTVGTVAAIKSVDDDTTALELTNGVAVAPKASLSSSFIATITILQSSNFSKYSATDAVRSTSWTPPTSSSS
ncbi:hypothetical protein ACH5RR_033159 [Cinchona calisaya]|uniref:Uncharacterized protein n=1 Tax=Cinchona calisaya TaxID=153742 RepID=A0ABD2YK67_9GENT